MTRQRKIIEIGLIVACAITILWVAVIAFGAPKPLSATICKKVAIVTTWSNTSDDPTLRIVKADTVVTWDTLPGIRCPGDTL